MADSFTGVRVIQVSPDRVNELYKMGSVSMDPYTFAQNEFVVLKAASQCTALTRAIGDKLVQLRYDRNDSISGVSPRNKEQQMAFDMLLDDRVKVCLLTGSAGTGKTLLALSAAMHLIERPESPFEGIVLTRPMSYVGKQGLGYLPGDVDEKFNPYLENYVCNILHLMNGKKDTVQHVIESYEMEFVPIQLIRGASWARKIIIADETQVLDHHEMVTLGTRVGEDSKLIIGGDLGQRDEDIAREDTGIYKLMNSEMIQESSIVAALELIKCERSEVAKLFAEVFDV